MDFFPAERVGPPKGRPISDSDPADRYGHVLVAARKI